MEKLEVALKSLCAHKGQWKIYVLNENLPTEWFTLMNRRLEAIDSEILNCRVSAESFKQFSLPSTHIHYATFFRYAIPEFVQEDRVLYLDCDMILRRICHHFLKWILADLVLERWWTVRRRQMVLTLA